MSDGFCHLHSHTSFSRLDGAMSPEQYVDAVASMGMKSAAITDHGYLYGLPHFQKAAEKKGIQPILGVEAYLVDSVQRVREEKDRQRSHQLLIAKNQQGLENLYRLMSWAATDGFYFRPLIDFEQLKAHSEGLIATSGCMVSYTSQILLGREGTKWEGMAPAERLHEAEKVCRWFLDVFGEDYYLEAHRHGIREEEIVAQGVARLSKTLGIKVITANDCHYVEPDDYHLQDAITCVGMGRKIDDADRVKIAHENLHIKTAEEMADLFPEFPGAPDATMEIAEKCDAKIIFHGLEQDYQFPRFPLPDGFVDPYEYLAHLCRKAFYERYPKARTDADYRQLVSARVKHELDVIRGMGFSTYFLIVQDIVSAAKDSEIDVGPGRGSAAGSIVAYLLGITGLDPLEHGLLFERFLNPERVSMPDIDIDFADDRRQEVIQYIIDRYGSDRVCQIITFGRLGAASGIQDFGRVLSVPYSDTIALTKAIPPDPKTRSKRIDEIAEEIEEIGRLPLSQFSHDRKLYEYTLKAHGYVRNLGVHAAGVVITPNEVSSHVPTAMSSDKTGRKITTQYDGALLDDLGLVKMDILGLKTLSVIRQTINLVKKEHPDFREEDMASLDDPFVYERIFARGDTLGIFQFESDGMREWLRKLKPTEFGDLVAMTSLYRPGPMDLIPSYIDRKHGREEVQYPHPVLEPVLEVTYGIPVYQEQVMEMAQVMAGYTLGEADLLRRAMGKKKVDEMAVHEDKFVGGAVERGIDESVARSTFEMMAKFAGYGFNRSHAAAYSVLSYRQAYLMAHYPVEFMAASIEREDQRDGKRDRYVQEAAKRGIPVLPPCVNESGVSFEVVDHEGKRAIRFGLSSIKKVGSDAGKVVAERAKGGPFTDYLDFMNRVQPRKDVAQNLILSGALDEIKGEYNRTSLFEDVPGRCKHLAQMRSYKRGTRKSIPAEPELVKVAGWSKKAMLYQEREVSGSFVSGHPLDGYEALISAFGTEEIDIGRKHARPFFGTITKIAERKTRKGDPMWFVSLHDGETESEYACFDSTNARFGAFIREEANVMVLASCYQGSWSTIEAVVPLGRVMDEWVQVVSVEVDSKEKAKDVLRLASSNEGRAELWINLDNQTYMVEGLAVQPSADLVKQIGSLGRVSIY